MLYVSSILITSFSYWGVFCTYNVVWLCQYTNLAKYVQQKQQQWTKAKNMHHYLKRTQSKRWNITCWWGWHPNYWNKIFYYIPTITNWKINFSSTCRLLICYVYFFSCITSFLKIILLKTNYFLFINRKPQLTPENDPEQNWRSQEGTSATKD